MTTVLNRARGAALASVAALSLLCGAPAASAVIITWAASLSGPSESPPNGSPGIGSTRVDYDTVANTMRVRTTFSGLLGNTTASHVHAATGVAGVGTAGVATQTPSFTGFPLGVKSGSMDTTFNMALASSFNSSYITANGGTPASALAALIAAMDAGKAYLNIHSSSFGGGEIRGFLTRVPSCPPDFDGDGFLTGDDFDAFVVAFESGSISSDFDGDGFVTGEDFDAYVVSFEAGC